MGALSNDLGLEGLGIGTAFLWHGRPLKKAKNGVHLNLGGHHRLNRWHQEDVLLGRLRRYSNFGYLLIGRLIERLTDLALDDAVIQRALSPLGISNVRFAKTRADLQTSPLGRASNYDPAWVYHGLLIGPISQAALFLDRLLCADLLCAGLLKEMQTARTLGGPIPGRPWVTPGYGLGLMHGSIDGGYSLSGHTGCGPGSVIAVYRICDGDASACCAAFEADASEGAVEALVVGQLMQVLRQGGDGIKIL